MEFERKYGHPFISIIREQPFPVYRRWLEEPYHRPLNNRIGRMGPHYGYTYRTTGTVNRGHVAMISANRDSNQENDNRSMIPIDFESPKMPKSGFQITAFFDQSTA